MNSSKVMGSFPEPLNLNQFFLKLNYMVAMQDEWQLFLGVHLHPGRKATVCSWMQMQINV